MRKVTTFLLIGLLLVACSAFADVTINNNTSGWVKSDGSHIAGNTNYIAQDGVWHDYFGFNLSSLTGTATSGTLNLYTYTIQGAGTFDIYSTAYTPAQMNTGSNYTDLSKYNGLTSGTLIGSIALTPGQSNTWIAINLNASGLSFLNANAGNQVVIGGNYFGGGTYAYGFSGFQSNNNLDLKTSDVPEPGSMLLFVSGLSGLAGLRKKLRK